MKAISGPLPLGDDWVYEIKWDGMRAIVYSDETGVTAYSSRQNDITARFPELRQLREFLGETDVVVDGELVALGDDGLPSFSRLQGRMHLEQEHEIERRRQEIPVVFVIFDLLRVDGSETLTLPHHSRRTLLESLVEPGLSWQLTTVHRDEPEELLEAVKDKAMEGLVAKRSGSRYLPGQRSSDWVKVKPRRRQEFVVGGWLTGEGGRAASIGALLIGYNDTTGLKFAGRVGSGLTDQAISDLIATLKPRRNNESPFVSTVPSVPSRATQFVEPEQVVEVAFAEWTPDGHLRHPVYLGRRGDADPTEVIREPDAAANPKA